MAEQTFENQMKRLEEIVRQMERGDVPLDISMQLFEEGTKLSMALSKILDSAEQKVSVMQENAQGEMIEESFGTEERKA